MNHQHAQTDSNWFVIIVAVFITCLLIANITALTLITIVELRGPAGIIIFPLSYICGDVLTEVYGYRRARQVIWLGFVCNLLAVFAIWDAPESVQRILGFTPRLLLAWFCGYLVGQFANAMVLARLKVRTGGRMLWARMITSTLVGQGLDALLFVSSAVWGIIPSAELLSVIVWQWLLRVAYEVLVSPVT